MQNQVVCPNCKTVLKESDVFCPMCGTKARDAAGGTDFCPGCGAKLSADMAFCKECGKPLGNTAGDAAQNGGQRKTFSFGKLLKKPAFLAIPAAAIILVIAIIAIAAASSAVPRLVYVKDNGLLLSKLSKKSPSELSSKISESVSIDPWEKSYGRYILVSDDGRYMFYPNRFEDYYFKTAYYWCDLKSDTSKRESHVRIDSDIIMTSTFLTKDGRKFFYIKGDDRRLYVYDRAADKKTKLDDYVEYFYVSDTGDYIIYSKYDGQSTLYEMPLKGTSGEKNKIEANATIVYASPGDRTVYYYNYDNGSLYRKKSGKDKEKIASEIKRVISVNDDGTVYYLKEETVVNKLSDFIDDDMAETDKKEIVLPEPNYPEKPVYPDIYDYQEKVWISDSFWGFERHPETNEWGYWITETNQEAYNAAVEKYYKEYEQWEKEVDKYNREYEEAYRNLKAQEFRKSLRNVFDSEENAVTYTNVSLCYWNSGTETVVADNIFYVRDSSQKTNAVLYQKYVSSDGERLKMSDLFTEEFVGYSEYDYVYNIQDRIRATRTCSEDLYIAANGKESVLNCESPAFLDFSSDGTLYFLDSFSYSIGYGNLMSVTIKNGIAGEPVKIDEEVAGYIFGNGNDNIYYCKDVKDSSGDIYINGKLLASDVYIPSLYNYKGSNRLIYLKDYSGRSRSGTLCINVEGRETSISDDASCFVPVNEKNIAFLSDYSYERNEGDLMLYTGKKKPNSIDTDVAMPLWNREMLWESTWNLCWKAPGT